MMVNETEKMNWSVQNIPHPDETISGDAFVAVSTDNGFFACVIDGLGHGEKASHASQTAVNALTPLPTGNPAFLLSHCHEMLTRTRGAVISMAQIDTSRNTLTWAGVGNVTGIVLKHTSNALEQPQREHLLTRGGIVGYKMPAIREQTLDFVPGDVLILATDGIKNQFLEDLPRSPSAEETASIISTQYRRGTDDSLVLVVKYLPD